MRTLDCLARTLVAVPIGIYELPYTLLTPILMTNRAVHAKEMQ
jgi:hypothetical protein